jgi:hypothetical protein
MANFTLESVIQRNEDRVITTELGDELVMLDIENGNYISVNRTGTIIWKNMEKPIIVADLITSLKNRYKIDELLCTNDTIAYLETLFAQKIINLV